VDCLAGERLASGGLLPEDEVASGTDLSTLRILTLKFSLAVIDNQIIGATMPTFVGDGNLHCKIGIFFGFGVAFGHDEPPFPWLIIREKGGVVKTENLFYTV